MQRDSWTMRWLTCALALLAACDNDKTPRELLLDAAPTGSCGGGQPACAADEYCDYSEHDCGHSSYGACEPKPTTCEAGGPPVCTCFGPVYPSACEALKDGKLLTTSFPCDVPAGKLRCGWELCDMGTQYCKLTKHGLKLAQEIGTCVDAPAACTSGLTCECLADQPCGATCEVRSDGALSVTCN